MLIPSNHKVTIHYLLSDMTRLAVLIYLQQICFHEQSDDFTIWSKSAEIKSKIYGYKMLSSDLTFLVIDNI